jgi:RNA polymerase sigma factor (sigma-70 family)
MMLDPSDAEAYEKYSDELVRFATMLVGPSNAEDVVADAVLRVFGSQSWLTVTNRRAYLYRSVLAQASSTGRSTRRRLAREQRFAGSESHDEPMLRPELLAALRALTVRQRAVVFMTYWLDQTTQATSQVLHMSERTVQRDLESAYRRMERHLHD